MRKYWRVSKLSSLIDMSSFSSWCPHKISCFPNKPLRVAHNLISVDAFSTWRGKYREIDKHRSPNASFIMLNYFDLWTTKFTSGSFPIVILYNPLLLRRRTLWFNSKKLNDIRITKGSCGWSILYDLFNPLITYKIKFMFLSLQSPPILWYHVELLNTYIEI